MIYYLSDFRKSPASFSFFEKAGQNSLTIYLFPDLLYYLAWMAHLPMFVYKQDKSQLLAVVGSLFWALVMTWIGKKLPKMGIQLKV